MSEVIQHTEQVLILTPTAIQQLHKIRIEQGVPEDHLLRIGIKGGGCSGFSYMMGFDLPKEQDERIEVDGIQILLQPAHRLYLAGMEIDWHEGLNNRGFVFNNPNATSTCGCGSSFSA